jgi:hypothetical protein
MLPSRVVATHQSRSSQPALFSFPPCSHASLFFPEDHVPSSATGAPQPFVYQSLPHSFHRDGGCTPLPPVCDVQKFRPADGSTCFRAIPCVFKFLRTLLYFFALFCTHARLNPFIFKRFRTLCEKPPRWGGGFDGLVA